MSSELVEQFEYLDGLRESGATNMWGASPYLAEAFGITKAEAGRVLSLWMRTFKSGVSAADRAAVAQEAKP